MAEPNIPVQHTSFWALQYPLGFHEAPQAGGSNSEKTGNQGRSLLRQHADHGKLQGGSSSPLSNNNASDSSGVYPQSQQECANSMGGTHSETLCNLSVHILKCCLERNIIFIHAEHLPRKLNVRADWHSRHTQDCSNRQLHPLIFQQLQDGLGLFSIDLFVLHTNAQFSSYCSGKLEPSAIAIDALSISWRDHHPYLFPPFSLLIRCLEKINREKVEAVVIAPVWCNQVWYPLLLHSLQDAPILLPNTMDIVLNPQGEPHPLVQEEHLPLACIRES